MLIGLFLAIRFLFTVHLLEGILLSNEHFTLSELDELSEHEQAQERRNHLKARFEAGQKLTYSDISEQYDISPSAASRDIDRLSEDLPITDDRGPNGQKQWYLDHDMDYHWSSEFDAEEAIRYIVHEAEGKHVERRNRELEDKEDVTIAYLSEWGAGTPFFDDNVVDGLSYVMEQKREDEGEEYFDDDRFTFAINGGALPFVSRRSYKTARQYNKALGTFSEKSDNFMAQWVSNQHVLENLIDDERLPDDPEEQEEYIREKSEFLQEEALKEESLKKITTLEEASDLVESYMDEWYEAAGTEFEIRYHKGEQGQKNKEELLDLKIRELSSELREDRLELLEEKMELRVDNLRGLQSQLRSLQESEAYAEHHALIDEYINDFQEHLEEISSLKDDAEHLQDQGGDPDDLADVAEDYISRFEQIQQETDILDEIGIEDAVLEQIDDYQKYAEAENRLRGEIRELQHHENSMEKEKDFMEFAPTFGWVQLTADLSDQLDDLAKNEYEEYIHKIGRIEQIADEPDDMRFEKGGWTVDMFHNTNLPSDEPLITGFKKDMNNYKDWYQDDYADVALFGHRGKFAAEPFKHGYSQEHEDITWAVSGPTLMGADLVHEHGVLEGLNLVKDAKRKSKNLMDSAMTFINLSTVEAPDGGLRKEVEFEIYPEEWLRNLGKQMNGDPTPGKDYTELDTVHLISRGDDQVGAPHDMNFMYRPYFDEVIAEDLYWVQDHLEDLDEDDEAVLFELGDALQGNDTYRGQKTEGDKDRGSRKKKRLDRLEEELAESDLEDWEKVLVRQEYNNRYDREIQINNLSDQADLVRDHLGQPYEQFIEEHGIRLYSPDGNHLNGSVEGINESTELRRMLNADYEEFIKIGSGGHHGELEDTFWAEDGLRPLKVRGKHRPEGRSYTASDNIRTQEGQHDFLVTGDKHQVAITLDGVMSGSGQSPNGFSRGKFDAPTPIGAVYTEIDKDPEKQVMKVRHVDVQGLNKFLIDEDEKDNIPNWDAIELPDNPAS